MRKFTLTFESIIISAGIFIACGLLLYGTPVVAQSIDNPNIDQIPPYLRYYDPNSKDLPLSSVITIGNFDNFNLGVDFAENNMAENPVLPVWYFTAYNTNTAHHSENGWDWTTTSPNFGIGLAGDPVVAYDSLGNLFYENLFPASSIQGAKVMKSSDNGVTWGAAVTAVSGIDKCWLACDQTSGPYANYVYACMTNNSGGSFGRSTDHGATFQNTFSPSTQNLPGMSVCVGPNNNIQGGSVYVVTNSGSAFASTYTFYRSTDGGANFTQMSSQQFSGYVGSDVGGRNSVQNMRTRPYPYIAADNSYGSHRGRLYNVYASNDPPGNGNKPDIWARHSDDGGTTWSSAVRVNDDANTQNNHQWDPAIWVDKQTGRFYVQFMDTRDCPTHDSALIYATYSDDGGVTWAQNQAISNKKMKIDCASCGGGGSPRYQGDYNGIISNKKVSMAGWTDFRNNSFMSVTGYFPDFAMAIDHTTDTLYTSIDSAAFQVSVPAVKLYTDTVLLSGTVLPVPSSGTITLHYPGGSTITTYPANKPVNVVLTGSVPSGTYQVTFIAAGPNGTPVHKRVATIKVLPGSNFGSNATAFPDSICQGQSTQLNVTVIGGTSPFTYSWTPAASLSNPAIANPVATPGVTTMYHVLVTDAQSHTSTDSVLVTVKNGPSAPGPINGQATVCVGTTTTYSIAQVAGATSYSWTVPAGDSIISGQNTTTITVKWDTASGTVSVIAGNACGTSIPSVLVVAVDQAPAPLGSITGPGAVCKTTTGIFSVAQVEYASSYIWTVPSGANIVSGQGTNTIHVTWGGNSGAVSVIAANPCDTTSPVTKQVLADSVPLAPGTISGPDTVCVSHTGYVFSIAAIPDANHYTWTLPTGAAITGTQDTSSIVVDFSASAVSGNIVVMGSNDCGDGPGSTKSVFVKNCIGGIQENGSGPGITVYPNPARDIVNISLHRILKEMTLGIYDVNGRPLYMEVLKNSTPESVKQVDVSGFVKGVYFIKLMDDQSLYIVKLIIQ
jgi:hypothetical protein